jgi:invasion protein IalB
MMKNFRFAGSALVLSVALVSGAVGAHAQQQKPAAQAPAKGAAPAAAPAAGAPAQAAEQNQSAWVKLCEKATLKKNDKEEKLDICLTHHERLDGNTGMVIVSAALREVQGNPKKHLMIMVPLGVALPAGLQIKIDEDKEPTKLTYTICHPGGCTAEVEASDEIVAKLKKGKQLMVAAMNVAAKPIFLPVPLTGFEPTLAGKPVDPEIYGKARANLMQEIERRQIEALNKAEEDAKKGVGAPAATGSTAPPPAAAPGPGKK